LTKFPNYARAFASHAKPFVIKKMMKKVATLELLTRVYLTKSKELIGGTTQFESSNNQYLSLDQYFKSNHNHAANNVHIVWKMNRVSAVRIIRKIFSRPYFISEGSEVALERYIFLDGPKSLPYQLPLTEFANVWLAQGQGYRMIALEPLEKCERNCSQISILLSPSDVLYYNWQVYRPRSMPVRFSNNLSITFMGSFY